MYSGAGPQGGGGGGGFKSNENETWRIDSTSKDVSFEACNVD